MPTADTPAPPQAPEFLTLDEQVELSLALNKAVAKATHRCRPAPEPA